MFIPQIILNKDPSLWLPHEIWLMVMKHVRQDFLKARKNVAYLKSLECQPTYVADYTKSFWKKVGCCWHCVIPCMSREDEGYAAIKYLHERTVGVNYYIQGHRFE